MNTTIQPIPELDYRTSDQKEQIHNWLAELGIRETVKKIQDEWGIPVTYNKLQRYRKRLWEKEQLAEHLEHEISMPEYLNLMNGRPVPYDQAGLALIQKRAFELAHQPKISASTLCTLQRVFNYKTTLALTERREARADQRLALAEKRLAQTDRRIDLAEKAFALRREESEHRRASKFSLSPLEGERAGVRGAHRVDQPQSDHLGPYARNLEEIRERARKHFGITLEESARRAALRKAWFSQKPENPYEDPTPDFSLAPQRQQSPGEECFSGNPSPDGTTDNSPAPSVPGILSTFNPVPEGRLNSAELQSALIDSSKGSDSHGRQPHETNEPTK